MRVFEIIPKNLQEKMLNQKNSDSNEITAYASLIHLAKNEEDFKQLKKFDLKKLDQTLSLLDTQQDFVDLKKEDFAFATS